jgi:subfamily B ATP-binding cassette protein MsbA
MGALERLTAGRTTIVIAHRLSTVRRADAVAVLEAGRIVQLGPHAELIATDGLYRTLSQLQGLIET